MYITLYCGVCTIREAIKVSITLEYLSSLKYETNLLINMHNYQHSPTSWCIDISNIQPIK